MFSSNSFLLSGVTAATVITITAAGFAVGGQSALTAYAETSSQSETVEQADTTEETALLTEEKLQLYLTNAETLKDGQLLLGNTLEKQVLEDRELRQERKAAAEKNKEEIRQIEEERARIAAEEAARKAEEEARRAASVISYSERDYNVLLRIVEAEAGICDMKGRILVANVIMNRVRSKEFPNNITDVVYQKSQFSPVSDGRLNTCKVTEETVEAVNRALAGEDHSQGALYFMNRKRSKSKNVRWFDGSLTYLFHHDRHDFYR